MVSGQMTGESEKRRPDTPQRDECGCGCDVAPIAAHFDTKVRNAGGALPPLHATTRGLLDLLGDPKGQTVLELGCGRGGLLQNVLAAGASQVTGIDLSRTSIEIAQGRLANAGLAERARFEVGDGATVGLEPHDWVVLDRVICCYPDVETLIRNSATAARRTYAFAVPNSRGLRGTWARLTFFADNLLDRVRRNPCTGYVHDLDRLEAQLVAMGLRRTAHATRGTWYLAVFARG